MADRRTDGFYVGYARFPKGIAALSLFVAFVLLALGLAGGFAWTKTARAPGSGAWGTEVVEIAGLIEAHPYPVMRAASLDGEPIGTVFLVSTGKLGAQDRLAGTEGQPAVARGLLVERGPLKLLELVDGQQAVEARAGDYIKLVPPTAIEGEVPRSFTGEVVDPKCYLGVMRPGWGRSHKGCADLCMIGGIPPFLVVRGADGAEHAFLLTGSAGEALPRDLLAAEAGRPIRLDGTFMTWGDLTIVGLEGDIERL